MEKEEKGEVESYGMKQIKRERELSRICILWPIPTWDSQGLQVLWSSPFESFSINFGYNHKTEVVLRLFLNINIGGV